MDSELEVMRCPLCGGPGDPKAPWEPFDNRDCEFMMYVFVVVHGRKPANLEEAKAYWEASEAEWVPRERREDLLLSAKAGRDRGRNAR